MKILFGGTADIPAVLAMLEGTEKQSTHPRRYYESQGFTATEPFTVDTPRGPWPGQLLIRPV